MRGEKLDYLKIQTNILKTAYARDVKHKNTQNLIYGTDEENVWVVDQSYAIAIPRNVFYLSIPKVYNKPPFNIGFLLKDLDMIDEVTKTGTMRQIGDRVCVEFDHRDFKSYVDAELLKLFNDEANIYKQRDKKSPLYLFNDDTLLGLVLSMNV